MITKRCGVNLGKEILEVGKQIFEVNDFWKKLSPLNNVIRKTLKGGSQKNRIIILETDIVNGLSSWLKRNKVKALFNPTTEEIREIIVSPYACFFLFTEDEYKKRQEIEIFQRVLKRLPNPLDLIRIGSDSKLSYEEVLEAFSEVNDLPFCARNIIDIKETTLVNLVIMLILYKNYFHFCCEKIFCTEEKVDKCKTCWSKFSLRLKPEFYDLIKSEGIYYPLSVYMNQEFPDKNRYIDINSYMNSFISPLEQAIFLHDTYQMGIAIYPGFGLSPDTVDRPDAYLLDYIYPLDNMLSLERVSSLIFLNALWKSGNEIKVFVDNIKNKIRKLPLGNQVNEIITKYTLTMSKCHELWQFNKEEILLLYAIWKLKKLFEFTYQGIKAGLNKVSSLKVKSIIENIHSSLFSYKDFLEHDLAIELGLNLDLIKDFFKNIDYASEGKSKVNPLEGLLLLFNDRVGNKLKESTFSYATKKVAASQIWESILSILDEMKNMSSEEIMELLPYVSPLFDYPIFCTEEKSICLTILRKKGCYQTKEIITLVREAIIDEIIARPLLSHDIDKLVNQWQTGNPLNFLKLKVREKIEQDEFGFNIFKDIFKMFCSINMLKLFRRDPSRFFEYERTLDSYVSLQLKKNGKQDFQPITSIFDLVRKLRKEGRKVIVLIFDGLGFVHFYFACLEASRKGPRQISEFLNHIVSSFEKGDSKILSSQTPTVTGANHIALFFGERLLYDDSFLIRMTDDSFMSNKGEDKAKIFSILDLSDESRKSAIWRIRLEESNLQRPTRLWDVLGGEVLKKGLLISANSERTLLSYLLKNNATFKQVVSYTDAIEEAILDKNHDLVIAQVNLMDAFLHSLNVHPPALIDNIVTGYWEVYLDLWKNVIDRIFKGFKRLKKGTTLIITADHGLAWGETSEFRETSKILGSVKDLVYRPKYRTGELLTTEGELIGACMPGHVAKKFMSIFLLKKGLDKKEKIKEALESARQANEIVFEEINIEEGKRNVTIKPDYLVFPTIGMFARPEKRKYYGGIHGGISTCELFIPLVQLEE